ncbi:histidine kinase [Stenotrophomonas pictorum JCM 9942]|uniref:Histidine kinase n=2 Tax=Stenotrophomonas pictorum TaxID=86184 RepID=A0A0R0A827_9GAMM|nr:histidine kinase [Stenotrophomonas pictorum]KRG41248.1 histidine kinase [Stenotrophomonas pictorum JCM 9942]
MPEKLPITPLDTLWKAPAVTWTVLAGEGLAIILALAPEHSGSRWVLFGALSFMIQWISLSALGALYLLRRPLSRLSPSWIANVTLLVLVLSTLLVCTASWWLLRDLWPESASPWQPALLRFTGIILTFGLLAVVAFQNHWRLRQLALRVKQAELEALQARIRPHFLFNTLNTGAAMVHNNPSGAEHLLLDLADLFRAALAGPQEIPLEEELALSRRYLEIEALRFGDRMRISWQLPAAIPPLRVPSLSIQPLVENAIHHGIEPSPEGGEICLRLTQSERGISITIENDLAPSGTRPLRNGHNVGLESARARIHAMTGGAGGVATRSENGRHITIVTLPIPP